MVSYYLSFPPTVTFLLRRGDNPFLFEIVFYVIKYALASYEFKSLVRMGAIILGGLPLKGDTSNVIVGCYLLLVIPNFALMLFLIFFINGFLLRPFLFLVLEGVAAANETYD